MTLRLISLSPVIGAAPGETVSGRVELHNDGSTDAVYTVIVVGLTTTAIDEAVSARPLQVAVAANSSVTAEIAVVVPRALGIGQHAAAFEVTSDRPDDRAVLTPFTVSIASVSRVELAAAPSTIRAKRRANFHLDVTNNEPQQVDLTVIGEAPDVEVTFTPSTFSLQPGQRAVAKGRVKGPRRITGEPVQHNILVTARGRASTTSVTTPYIQRPVFAHRLRMVVAGITVVALWLAAIGGVALWLNNRDSGTADTAELIGIDTDGDGIIDAFRLADGTPVTGTDTDGDGIPDTFIDADGNVIVGVDTDGDGVPDTIVDTNGDEVAAVDTDGDGIPDALSDGSVDFSAAEAAPAEPSTVELRGTVNADGDPTEVSITLTPIDLGVTDTAAAPVGFRGAVTEAPSGKIWSARTATLADLAPTVRRTVAIPPTDAQPNEQGVWLFTDVVEGQSYEVAFVRPGYDTQAFIVTPPAGGEPIELDVEMVPSKGSLSGAVVGPSGGLGGAEVTVTDGTLTFTTTSASGTGAWSIDAVSTPGVYTVSAALRGFATAVEQVELGPGDTPDNVDLRMVPGLGTMTGRVADSNGVGLGGATVTASNGDVTLTTTTLTDGNVGFFSLPQLAIPGTYTVAVELDGYITQTQRVPLDGSLDGIDFAMTSTTLRLTGQILSSGGGGIESAGLTISTADLQFRATTSTNGVFEIDRLPPGNYTVTVEHFQHQSATEFLTLEAGEPPEPLQVTLQVTTGPPAIGRGSMEVAVLNDDPLVVPPGISGATVTLTRNRTTDAPRVLTDSTTPNVLFEDLPIGTYTVRVVAPGFNPSPPITRSVGFGRERVEVRLQKLGQAGGTVVDSLTDVPLTGYIASIYKVQGGTDAFIESVPERGGRWQTSADKLTTGTYRVEISPPPGYVVRGDQVLDPATGRAMTFLVPLLTAAAVEPVDVPAIEADAYPGISGRIYKPRLNGAAVEFDAIDEPALRVTATCNSTPVTVTLSDEFGTIGADRYDTFSISSTAIAAAIPPASLPGACTVTANTPDRTPSSYTFTNVDASNGVTRSDRRVGMALAKPAPALSGQVFWIDTAPNPDRKVFLPDVAISTTSDAIVGFLPVESSTGEPTPGLDRQPLATTSIASPATPVGGWRFDRQVFGTTIYQFVTPNFGTGLVPVTIDDSGTLTVPSNPPTAAVVTPNGGGFDIELTPPAPGSVSGTVTIETSRRTPNYPLVTATTPTGATRTTTPSAVGGTYSFSNAEAGTWNVAFATPPNHQLITPPGGSADTVVDPGQPAPPVNASFVELGTVEIRLLDKTTGLPISPAPDAGLTLSGFADLTRPSGPPVDGKYSIARVPVAASNAATTPVTYTARLDLDGYDLAGATVNGLPVDAEAIPISVRAGQVVTLDIGIEKYGRITGSLVGQTGTAPATEPLSFTAPTNPATLSVERVDALGNPVTGPAPIIDLRADGTFTIEGDAGFYRLTPGHPQYQPTPAVTPVGTLVPPSIALPANVFEMRNEGDNALAAYELALRTGSLTVSAVTDLASGVDVVGAVYDIAPMVGTCVGVTGAPPGTAIDPGGTTITGLAPGTYCLAVNKFLAGVPDAFPAIVAVQIPRGTAASPSASTVVAPLPPLRPTVTGVLVAQNTLTPSPGTVDLISTTPVVLTSSYNSANDVLVNGASVDNIDTGASSATATPTASPTDYSWTYTFDDLPYGNHTITAPTIPGYTLVSSPANETVDDLGPSPGPTFVYQVASTAVEFELGAGAFPSLDPAFPDTKTSVTLTVNGSSPAITYTAFRLDQSIAGKPNVLVIDNVAPDVRGYTLTFDDALHEPVSASVVVPLAINSRDRRSAGAIATTADLVRLTGTALQRTGPTTTTGLQAGAVLTLAGSTTYTVRPSPGISSPGTSLSGTIYTIDALPGTYALSLAQSGYDSKEINPVALATAGTVVTANIEVERSAVVTVTTTSSLAAPTGLTLQLIDATSGTSYSPRAGTNIFDVPAGTYYARAQAPGYPDQRSANTIVTIGTTPTINLTLPRVVRVTAAGAAALTVEVLNSSDAVVSTQTGGPGTYEFLSNGPAPAIPAAGALRVRVRATGSRAQVINVGTVILNTPTPSVTIQLNVTATGTIAAPDGTNVIRATAPGMSAVQGSVLGGSYSISGLGVGPLGEPKIWTLSYDVIGGGRGTTALASIDGTSSSAVTQNFPALDVRNVDFDFQITRAGGGNLEGAIITVRDADDNVLDTDTTGRNGRKTLTVPENAGPMTWTVTEAGSLTKTGNLPAVTTLADTPVNVAMVAAVVGTVTDATVAVVGATVTVCPASATTAPCASPSATATTIAGGQFTFNDEIAVGSYRVWAVNGAKNGSTTLTVTSSAATLGAAAIPIV